MILGILRCKMVMSYTFLFLSMNKKAVDRVLIYCYYKKRNVVIKTMSARVSNENIKCRNIYGGIYAY